METTHLIVLSYNISPRYTCVCVCVCVGVHACTKMAVGYEGWKAAVRSY